jgi:CSLREA domain-containing protein
MWVKRLNRRLIHLGLVQGIVLLLLMGIFPATPTLAATTLNVTKTADTNDGVCNSDCSLREAVAVANATPSGSGNPVTINIPPGTYNLSLGQITLGSSTSYNIVLHGTDPNPANTVIQQDGKNIAFVVISYIFDLNISFENLTITGGFASVDSFGGAAIQAGGQNQVLNVTNCIIRNNINVASAAGGGGIAMIGGGNLNVSNSIFENNKVEHITGPAGTYAVGGAIFFILSDKLSITGSIFDSNLAGDPASAPGLGGAIGISDGTANSTISIDTSVFVNNKAWDGLTNRTVADQGKAGAISLRSGAVTGRYNYLVGNTASVGNTLWQPPDASITSNFNDNWWGSNSGPTSGDISDTANRVTHTSWLQLRLNANPSTLAPGGSSQLTADLLGRNTGGALLPASLQGLPALPFNFGNAKLGSLSNVTLATLNGVATATYTAGSSGGNGSVDVTLDNQTLTAAIGISSPPVVTTQPGDQSVCSGPAGTPVSFTATASGFPTPTQKWEYSTNNGTSYSGSPVLDAAQSGSSIYLQVYDIDNGTLFRSVFTNSLGSATSKAALLTVNTLPTLTTQPASQSASAGSTVTFSAAGNGRPAPTVQWQVSPANTTTFTDIVGATAASLSFTATAADNGKQYRAVFTNGCGTVNSNPATLTVTAPPVITQEPLDQAKLYNSAGFVTFNAAASGSPTPTVQWQLSPDGLTFTDITGANDPTLSLQINTVPPGIFYYRAVFTNSAGTATTKVAKLTIGSPVNIALQPLSQTLNAGDSVTFTAGSYGTPHPTVQWQVSINNGATFADIAGATATNPGSGSLTTTSLSFIATSADNGKQYRAVFTNVFGTDTTNPATLTVKDVTPPVVTLKASSQPNANGYYNAPVTFTFTGTDDSGKPVSCDNQVTYSGPDITSTTVTGYCTDQSGNKGSAKVSFGYDATLPTNLAGTPDRAPDAGGYYSQPVKVTFSGSDATSGIASCSSSTYNGPDSNTASVPGSCTDKAGNSASATFNLKYDATKPTTTASGVPNGPVNATVTVNLNATDNLSGIKSITYALNGGTPTVVNAATATVTIKNEGTTTLTFFATDNAGNVEATQTKTIQLDLTPPEFDLYFDANSRTLKLVTVDNHGGSGAVTDLLTLPVNSVNNPQPYVLKDKAGNTLTIYLRRITSNQRNNFAGVEFSKLVYSNGVTLNLDSPYKDNSFSVDYSPEAGKPLTEVNQNFELNGSFQARANFKAKQNQTQVSYKRTGESQVRRTDTGLTILHAISIKGKLDFKL